MAGPMQKYSYESMRQVRRRRRIMYGLGGCFIIVGSLEYKFKECIDVVGNPQEITSPHRLFWLRLIFGRTRSRLFGMMAENTVPLAMREPLYKSYAWMYAANLDEIRYPIDSYRCLQDFFHRNLKDGARPIADAPLVSPCDAQLLCMGDITESEHRLPMIKGATYNIRSFLGIDPHEDLPPNRTQKYAVLYLAPGDYHRVHAPCRMQVLDGQHFAGEALPLFKGLLTRMNDVFCVNERVVLSGLWESGRIFVSLVAAYNVNGISLAFEKNLKTNDFRAVPAYRGGEVNRRLFDNVFLEPGEHLGGFKMGSTVVVVFDAKEDFQWDVKLGDRLRVGQAFGH
eukprot:GEMP01043619.1.p1 GENE.GEMP01043619.1~~GEMP01043619.1.p1  ORF type:complete len:340 (-),score=73.73 GEMP01043619.1:687-1706(-)